MREKKSLVSMVSSYAWELQVITPLIREPIKNIKDVLKFLYIIIILYITSLYMFIIFMINYLSEIAAIGKILGSKM